MIAGATRGLAKECEMQGGTAVAIVGGGGGGGGGRRRRRRRRAWRGGTAGANVRTRSRSNCRFEAQRAAKLGTDFL